MIMGGDIRDDAAYEYQTIIDNIAHLTPACLSEVAALVAEAGPSPGSSGVAGWGPARPCAGALIPSSPHSLCQSLAMSTTPRMSVSHQSVGWLRTRCVSLCGQQDGRPPSAVSRAGAHLSIPLGKHHSDRIRSLFNAVRPHLHDRQRPDRPDPPPSPPGRDPSLSCAGPCREDLLGLRVPIHDRTRWHDPDGPLDRRIP